MSKKEKVVLGMGLKSLLEEKEEEDLKLSSLHEDELDLASEVHGEQGDSPMEAESDETDVDVTGDEEDSIAPQEPEELLLVLDDSEETEPETNDPPAAAQVEVVVDDVEILQSFIEESQDHLENIEEKILKLEATSDSDVVNDIFRSMHTMKGTSAFFGFVKIKELSHVLESVLDDLRADKISVSPELVDILLAGTDMLSRMIGDLRRVAHENQGSKGKLEIPDSGIDITPVLSRIQEIGNPSEKPPAVEKPAVAEKKPNDVEELITDEMREKFISESRDLLDGTEKDFLELEKRPDNNSLINDAFRAIHTIKGNAGFLGYSDFEVICMEMESVFDSIRTGEKQATPKVVTMLLNVLDSMRKALGSLHGGGEQGGAAGGPADSAEEQKEYKAIGEILVEMGEVTGQAVDEALDKQDRKVGEILVDEGKVSEETLEKALTAQRRAAPADQIGDTTTFVARKDIRVDMEKLDKMFDLMGELITAEAMVISNPELANLEIESFSRASNYLSKITREMQEITMTVRMIPLEGLFNKMRRLVRDLSRKFGKKIDFRVSGQETEMDRNVIEAIADPLVHIIRNAIDHGIEDENTRMKNGKNEVGLVSLSAKYEGNEIWITVGDDGMGLDKQKILRKAQERGLLKGDPESMRDDDVWQILFEPGFSTAEEVSEISGRGVGMDVVKRNVEKLRGKTDIKSTPGEGAKFILRIPLTLAIMDGIFAEVGNIQYALPLGDILEFHKASAEQITRTDTQREVLRLREEIIPIIKLFEFFGSDTDKTDTSQGILIIAQANGQKAGLLVDDVLGNQQIVVKSLPEYLGGMRAISGCSIMGDGGVSLIIDTASLLKEELE